MSITSTQEMEMSNFVEIANWHLKSIVETDDFQVVMLSANNLYAIINNLLVKIFDSRKNDERLTLKCLILMQKMEMLLDALNQEARKNTGVSLPVACNEDTILKMNTNEGKLRQILRSKQRAALQSRADNVKRAINDVMEHLEQDSISPSHKSPSFCIPAINIISPSGRITRPKGSLDQFRPMDGKQYKERNVYTNDIMIIIDTDPLELINDEDNVEASSFLSANSNEKCCGRPEMWETTSSNIYRQFNAANLIQEPVTFSDNYPARSQGISSGSPFESNDATNLIDTISKKKEESSGTADEGQEKKKLPITNPLGKFPIWSINADSLCAADPSGKHEIYPEEYVMNNYFGIGIDAKIILESQNKGKEHPEKCRLRAKNYIWYESLRSKQLLHNTYKNLEQRIQLKCDGQRIQLPTLHGIVIRNIPSYMGGTNFWGGKKADDCSLPQCLDDRILEVVAVFGSLQMAASRFINFQRQRIAQCRSVEINILGDEEVPIQVDDKAWLQPPSVIRITFAKMFSRNRHLEKVVETWQEKRRHSIT
ncbi:unnamed protein product [Hermetia illucens]|uniref:Diacylglycerol kinase accessory domain-containing protein n=1 Tax=Hermetia illucens TaxID=343691 RepID=A0A7R8V6P0_HERIL|nr:unnamed protein product [Hermetia illucens]